jgi:hypothetical protein
MPQHEVAAQRPFARMTCPKHVGWLCRSHQPKTPHPLVLIDAQAANMLTETAFCEIADSRPGRPVAFGH